MSVSLRPAAPDDEAFLWDMLYAAIYVPPDEPRPARDIIYLPELALYGADWGHAAGDFGIVAESDRVPIGAAWVRLWGGDQHGYGYVEAHIPELSMAVAAEWRGQGVGTHLLTALFDQLGGQYAAVSLSVSPDNPALRLYERFGFSAVGMAGDSITMVKQL